MPGMGGGVQGGQGAEHSADAVHKAKVALKAEEERRQSDHQNHQEGTKALQKGQFRPLIENYFNTVEGGTWNDLEAQLRNNPEMPGAGHLENQTTNVNDAISDYITEGVIQNYPGLPNDSLSRLKQAIIQQYKANGVKFPGDPSAPLTWEEFKEFAEGSMTGRDMARMEANFKAVQERQADYEAPSGLFGANDLGQQDVLIA